MKAISESFLHLINCGEYKTIMKITYVSFRFCVTYNKRDLKIPAFLNLRYYISKDYLINFLCTVLQHQITKIT